jgi:hypothetical protein
MNTFPISLRGTTPSVGVGWVGLGRKRSFGDRIPIGKLEAPDYGINKNNLSLWISFIMRWL